MDCAEYLMILQWALFTQAERMVHMKDQEICDQEICDQEICDQERCNIEINKLCN